MAGELYYSGADVLVTIKDVVLSGVSFIQIVPQQAVIPVYSVFSETPSVMLKGKSTVRGTLAFNMQFAQPFEHLADQMPDYVFKHGDNIYYVKQINVIVKSENRQPVQPNIELNGVYITGGTVNAVQDGNPLQDVYSFTALNMVRYDKIT